LAVLNDFSTVLPVWLFAIALSVEEDPPKAVDNSINDQAPTTMAARLAHVLEMRLRFKDLPFLLHITFANRESIDTS
jgi:hypothetical protein